ncbi:hypothetical protein ACW0JT_18105 [Arthrobacter sp. SA17]
MRNQLVFIHGRAQENKDPVKLKQAWVSALQSGMKAAGRTMPLADEDIHFVYYGDALKDFLSGSGDVAEVIARGQDDGKDPDPFELATQASIVEEIRKAEGITDDQIAPFLDDGVIVERGVQNWPWVLATIRAIEKYTDIGPATIYLLLKDVHHYLHTPGTLQTIERGVSKVIKAGIPTVFVAHSLGSIVAYHALKSPLAEVGWTVPLFVTLGSPLGIKAVKSKLAPIKHPVVVDSWFNARDPRDVVALRPLDTEHFPVDPAVVNKNDVDNWTDDRHGIEGYLDDAEVAERIWQALS